MQKEKIETKKALQAIGPYSQAVKINKFIFCSGQIGINIKTGNIVKGGVENETIQILKNIKEILKAANSSLENVIKTEIFLKNIKDFSLINNIYEKFFEYEIKPARVTVEVSQLPKNALIEISCIAYEK